MPENPIAVKTIVTTDIVNLIGKEYGVEIINVLTGFKFIGEQIGLLEAKGEEKRYIWGFEESYGYLSGSYVRDKDAVDASMLICEMAAYYRTQGITLLQARENMYKKYGFFYQTLYSFTFEGASGMKKMADIMEICEQYKCSAKVFTHMKTDLKKQIGCPDLLVLFTGTMSHKMARCAISETKGLQTKIERSHSSSASALKNILETHTGRN